MRSKLFVLTVLSAALLVAPAFAVAGPKQEGHQHAVAAADKAPARQGVVVWFMRPVLVGHSILQGKYIIEHDTDRQARGEPCTYIYAANDRKTPVVVFHCLHLEKNVAENATVTLISTGDPSGLQKLSEFQFAGDTAAHGVPKTK